MNVSTPAMHKTLLPQPIRLYRAPLSGHSHRVELFLSLLGLPCTLVNVDLAARSHKTPEFLAMNPFGQVPVIQDGPITLADSNAILVYLARRYGHPASDWLPSEATQAAAVQRWLSVAAGPLAFGPAAARLSRLLRLPTRAEEAETRAHALLIVMEGQLGQSDFLAGNHVTLADIANYSYVAHAPEGGVSLQTYPAVRAWLARIEALPGYVPMLKSPVDLAA